LTAFLAEIEVEVHRHGHCSECKEPIIREPIALVPLFSSPFHVFDILSIVHMSIDIDLCRSHDNLESCLHGWSSLRPAFSALIQSSQNILVVLISSLNTPLQSLVRTSGETPRSPEDRGIGLPPGKAGETLYAACYANYVSGDARGKPDLGIGNADLDDRGTFRENPISISGRCGWLSPITPVHDDEPHVPCRR
jgi:hypothetical protein